MNKSEWISNKIGILIREGRPKDQAAAIAYSMWERGDHMQEGGTRQPAPRYGVESMFPVVRMEKATRPEAYGGTGVYQGYNAYYKDPQAPDFNPESDMVFYTNEEIEQKRGMAQPSSMAAGQYDPYVKNYFDKMHGQVGKTMPTKQGGGYYNTYNPYFTTNPGAIPQQPTPNVNLGGRNAFSQPNFNPNPSLGFEQGNNYMGLGRNEDYKSQVSPESLTAGQEFAKKSTLPQGVFEQNVQGQPRQGQPQMAQNQNQQDWIKYNILNPYRQGMDLNTSLAYTGQQFGQGNTGRGILGAGLSALKGARSFMSGYASGKGQQTLEQKMYDNLYNSDESLYNRNVTTYQSGGIHYAQEAIMPNEMVNKYGEEPMADYSFPQNEPVPTTPVEQVVAQTQQAPAAEEKANFDKSSARDTWVQKTGKPWSEAKRLGYTDGSAKDNMKLLSELNDPRFKAENLRTKPFSAPIQQAKMAAKDPIASYTTLPEMVIDKRKSDNSYDENVYNSILAQGNHYFGSPRWKALMDTAGVTGAKANLLSSKDRKEFYAAQKAADDINLLREIDEYTSSNQAKIMNDLAARGALSNQGKKDYDNMIAKMDRAQAITDNMQALRKKYKQEGGYSEPRKGEFDENQRGSMYNEGGMHVGQEYDLTDEEIHDLLSKGYKLRYK